MVKANRHKYSVRAMCSLLKISRNACYYTKKEKKCDTELENEIIRIFRSSRDCYGTRKIKRALGGRAASRRYIANVMKKYGLVSKYTQRLFKHHKSVVNEENVPNVVNREFSNRERLEVAVSDLTYVRVGNEWNYVCLIIDLHNREIIGKACGRRKEAALVEQAFLSIRQPLDRIAIFHTDRGSEFKNECIDRIIKAFGIRRSLSRKGCPYDNAVAEATYSIFKAEFVAGSSFSSLKELERTLNDYVLWYNNVRLHGSLGYLSPVAYRQSQNPPVR